MADHPTIVFIAGCGYVGSELAKQLLESSSTRFSVWGMRRNIHQLPDGVHPVVGNLYDSDQLGEWPERIDYLVYAAAANGHSEEKYRLAYVDGLKNVLSRLQEKGIQPKRIVFTSSTHVYHQKDGVEVDETSNTLPESFAGKIMLEAESLIEQSPFPSTAVRFGSIYGPGRKWLVNQVKAKKGYLSEPVIYTNRIHRDDCAGILVHLIKRDINGLPVANCYLGVDCCPSSIQEIMQWIADQLEIELDHTNPIPNFFYSSKRCSNERTLETGYTFHFPNFKAGYTSLLD